MNLTDWWTLVVAVVVIALLLLLEHLLTGSRHWPQRLYYAEGLVTVLAGLLGWAAIRQIRITPAIALVLLLAGCASGGLDFIVLWREQREMERKWAALEATNQGLATQLRCLLSKQTNSRYMSRLRQMVETAAFAAAAMRQEREMMELAQKQAEDLLKDISGMVHPGAH